VAANRGPAREESNILATYLVFILAAVPLWAKEYRGMLKDENLQIREIAIDVQGSNIKATFHKAMVPMTMPDHKVVAEVVENPGNFVLWPDGSGGSCKFVYNSGDDTYLVSIRMAGSSLGRSGHTMAEGVLNRR